MTTPSQIQIAESRMNTRLFRSEDELPDQLRAMLEAARQLGLPIGGLTPKDAFNYIVQHGHSEAVSRKARELYSETF